MCCVGRGFGWDAGTGVAREALAPSVQVRRWWGCGLASMQASSILGWQGAQDGDAALTQLSAWRVVATGGLVLLVTFPGHLSGACA